MPARRLLFFLVLILWVCNGALWAWVKASAPAEGPDHVRLIVRSESAAQAKKLQKALEGAGLQADMRPNQPWKHEVIEGYKVYITQSNKDLAGPMAQGMRNKGLSVKVVGDEIQLGGTYKTKADANKAKAQAARADFTGFQVREHRVQRTAKAYVLKLGPLDGEQHEKVQGLLAKFQLKPEQIETESVADAAATPSATPE